MKTLTFSKVSMSVAALVLLAVAGCGSGGGGDSGTSTTEVKILSGTAATGSPITSGTVTLKDSSGVTTTTTTTTKANGSYSIDVSATHFPAMLKVQPNVPGAVPIYSVAVSPGTANVNPLTSLVIYEGVGRKSLNDIFLNGDFKTLLTGDNIEIGKSVVLNNFPTQLQAYVLGPAKVDLITTPMLADGTGIDGVLDNTKVTIGDQSVTVTDAGGAPLVYNSNPEFEDPASQRKVAEKLFQEDLKGCIDDDTDDSVRDFPNPCKVKYNYNLWGMPGCWEKSESNYIGHYQYQKNDNGVTVNSVNGKGWKENGFKCAGNDSYNGLGHNGIDIRHETPTHEFYAVSSGKLIKAGGGTENTIAIYDADPSEPNNTSKGRTTLYLHASQIDEALALKLNQQIEVGARLGKQGHTSTVTIEDHVHISVRVGRNLCACSWDTINGDYLPPVATALRYLAGSPTQPADTTAPATPTGLAATAASTTQINLSWSASPASDVAGYRIYRGGTEINFTTSTSYSDTSLSASTPYCYTVSAYDTSNNKSSQSSSVCATTSTAVDSTLPQVAITSPGASGTTVNVSSSSLNISGTASDNVGVTQVSWTNDTGGSGVANGTTTWSVSGITLQSGWNTITVTAYDAAGNWNLANLIVNYTAAPSTWTKTFGGALDDSGNSVQQTSDGGYIIAGSASSYGAGGSDVYLLKLDASGNKVWDKTFGGSLDDWASSVRQTSDGGYILVGGTESFGAGGEDVYLVKTDADGNKVWDKTFGGINRDFGHEVKQTSDGGYIITGIYGYSASDHDVYLIRTDANGNKLWDTIFGGSSDDGGWSVQQTTDGGFIIAGGRDATYTFNTMGGTTISSGDAYLIKTDSNGNKIWGKSFGSTSGDIGLSVQQVSDGGYIISGWKESSTTSFDVYLVKADTNGNMVWEQTFGGTYKDYGDSVQQTSDGGYTVSGMTASSGAGGGDVYLIKTNSSGSKLWEKTFGGTLNERGLSAQQTSDGSYIVVGYTYSYGAGGRDIYAIKTDSSGTVQAPLQSPALSPAKSSTPATRQYIGVGMEPMPMSR